MERKNKEVSACEPRCAGNKWQWRGKQQQAVCQWGNVKLVSWWTKVEIIGIWNTFITSIHMGEDCINSTCPCFISSLQWLKLGWWPEQWLLSLPAEFEPMYSSVTSFCAGSPTLWRSCHSLEKNLISVGHTILSKLHSWVFVLLFWMLRG